ncbi:MAG: OB-fold domain-containing protein [Planctomycetes bacterium]|nr:OB-fold domain-containing protein [Planctomycetota bacterium]
MNTQFPELIPRLESYSTIKTWREHDGRYRLQGTRCRKCSEKWFPPRVGLPCPKCHAINMEPYECARTGEVISFQLEVMGYPAMGYGELSPRKICIIKLDDGIHIIGEVVDCGENDVHPAEPTKNKSGTRVKMVFRKQKREETGNWMYGYKFVIDPAHKK